MMSPSTRRHGRSGRHSLAGGQPEKPVPTGTEDADAARPRRARRPGVSLRLPGLSKLPGLPDALKRLGPPSRRTLLIAGGVLALVVACVVAAVLLLGRPSVRVPSLVGVSKASAAKRAEDLGLKLVVKGTTPDPDVVNGAVASQDPTAGALVPYGSDLTVLISAGSDAFALPDVVGMTLAEARTALRAQGLDVQFVTAPSDAPTGTVTASAPAAGAKVASGDVVRLTIAGDGTSSLPADLSSAHFLIDATPRATSSAPDAAYEVATRLASLLREGGATVTLTRDSSDADDAPSAAARTKTAQDSSATVFIGLTVASTGLEHIQVLLMPTDGVSAGILEASAPLSDAVLDSLRTQFSAVSTVTDSTDSVMKDSGMAGVRVKLGSAEIKSDRKLFATASWLDRVAREIFRGLTAMYGRPL